MSNETRRILLVEDEKAIRDAVAAYLERENYWVTAVGDGQEASKNFPSIISTWSCSTSCFPVCRASACAVPFATIPMCLSSCSPRRVRLKTASSASSLAPTTIW